MGAYRWLRLLGIVLALAGCGGGGGDGGTATPPVTAPLPTIGAAGGQVALDDGARVVVPAGVFTQDVTLRIAKDGTGAPALPASLKAAGSTYAITPHGGSFAQPIEVRLPLPATPLRDNEVWAIAKADPGGEWVVQGDSAVRDGMLVTRVNSFSYFMPVAIAYATPLATTVPWSATIDLQCDGQPCSRSALPTQVDFIVTSNRGQLPASCTQGATVTPTVGGLLTFFAGPAVPVGSQAVVRASVEVIPWRPTGRTAVLLECKVDGTRVHGQVIFGPDISFDSESLTTKPRPLSVLQMPPGVQAATGAPVDIRAVLTGAAAQLSTSNPETFIIYNTPLTVSVPSARDQAVTSWFISRDLGASWSQIGESFQVDADPVPFAALGLPMLSPWLYWSHTLRYGPVSAADHGALVRVQSCYTAPGGAAPECVTGPTTRLSLLQGATAPAFTQQPRSLILQPGQTASLNAVANGAPTPTLQWQTRAAGATLWTDIASGGQGTTYTTLALALADDGVQYRVVATNAAGSSASDVATVFVRGDLVAPALGTQPQSLSVAAGSEAVFAVNATGTEALSYQWFRNGNAITGANAPQLKLAAVTSADAGSYTVRVSNAGGSVTSNAATLTVTAGAPGATAPVIVTQPTSVNVTVGNTATFAVGVTGSGPMSFQWRKDGIDIAGATAAAYTLPTAADGDAGDYTVRVGNSAGSVTSQVAALKVAAAGVPAVAPSFTVQPSGVVVAPGMSFTIAVGVQGTGPFSYQWQLNGQPLAGQTGPLLAVGAASALDGGSYRVQISNAAGSILSDAAQVILLGAPVITAQPAAASATAGGRATFAVTATGDALRYQWTKNGVAIGGANGASYTTPTLTLGDSGALYGVVVYNGAGLVFSSGAVLTVMPAATAPSVAVQPTDLTVTEGNVANFSMTFGGTAPITVTRVALVNGVALEDPVTGTLANFDGTVLMSTGVLSLADDGAQFAFHAVNSAGGATTRLVRVTVLPADAAYEAFDYPLGDRLAGKTGGVGWGGAWEVADGSTGAAVDPSLSGAIVAGLEYTDANGKQLLTSGGAWQNDATIGTNIGGLARRLTSASFGAPGSTRWVSLLVRQASVATPSNIAAVTLGTDARLGLTGPSMAGITDDLSAFIGCLYCRSSNGAIPGLGTGVVVMMLVRVDFGATGDFDTMSLWINPPLDPAVPLGSPTLAGFGRFADSISGLSLLHGTLRSFTFDELRIAPTRVGVSPMR